MPQSYNLHGYQPLLVDEDCLTDEERREAFEEALRGTARGEGGGDWRTQLTRQELAAFEKELDELRKNNPYLYRGDAWSPIVEKKFEMAHLGRLRAFGRRKYAGGRRVWLGDGTFRSTTG